MNGTEDARTTTIVDATGRPARQVVSRDCPACGAGPERRRASSGFGQAHPVCGKCGHEFHGERIE